MTKRSRLGVLRPLHGLSNGLPLISTASIESMVEAERYVLESFSVMMLRSHDNEPSKLSTWPFFKTKQYARVRYQTKRSNELQSSYRVQS